MPIRSYGPFTAFKMRTEDFKDFETRLSTINKLFSHSLFLSEQFLIDNSEIIRNYPETLSGDIYAYNVHSKNFNYKLRHVPNVINEFQSLSFISFYIFIYSTFESYVESLYQLVRAIRPKERWVRPEDTPTLDVIFLYLDSGIASHLGSKERDTLKYIRLRRNCLVHADGKPSSRLSDLIGTKGRTLNEFWRGLIPRLSTIDFSSGEINQFRPREIIDIILILRTIAKRIDQEVLTLLKKEAILEFILSDFKVTFAKEIKGNSRDRVENMFAAVAKRKFNVEKKDIDFKEYFKTLPLGG